MRRNFDFSFDFEDRNFPSRAYGAFHVVSVPQADAVNVAIEIREARTREKRKQGRIVWSFCEIDAFTAIRDQRRYFCAGSPLRAAIIHAGHNNARSVKSRTQLKSLSTDWTDRCPSRPCKSTFSKITELTRLRLYCVTL